MFTGIVSGRASVREIVDNAGLRRLVVRLPDGMGAGIMRGASVALAGTCLTVVDLDGDVLHFDCIGETLSRTTIGRWRVGEQVNVERAARIGDEIGGHLLSGHILGAGRIVSREEDDGNLSLGVEIPAEILKYVFSKGYIGIDGVSLTVGALDSLTRTFQVHLIPETRRVTTLDALLPGETVNIEVDAITQAAVDTVERVLAKR